MKAPDFAYHRPERLAEAIELLGSLENAKLLAGGQSLMPMLNMRYVIPDHVIDINRIRRTGRDHDRQRLPCEWERS